MATTEPRVADQTYRPDTTDESPAWLRLAAIAGIVHVVLFVGLGGAIASGAPLIDQPASEIREWFADNGSAISFFTWAGGGVTLLFMAFAAGLRHVLASTDVDRATNGFWSRLFWAGIIAQFASALVGLAIWGVLAQESVIEEISDGTLLAFSALDTVVFFVCMQWASTLFSGAAAVVILRSKVLPTWLGAIAALSAILGPVSGLWIVVDGDPAGPLAGIGFVSGLVFGMLFILGTSVSMLKRRTVVTI